MQKQSKTNTEPKTNPIRKQDSPIPQEKPKMRLKSRGSDIFTQHTFKSDVNSDMHNISFQRYKPQIVRRKHTHIYRNYNARGKEIFETTPVGGHYHDVVTKDADGNQLLDANGFPTVKCGPPMRIVTRKRPDGATYKVREKVYFTDEKMEKGFDEHTHKFTYEGSEEISSDKKKTQMLKDRATLRETMGDALDNAKIIDHTPAPLTAEDGWTITEIV